MRHITLVGLVAGLLAAMPVSAQEQEVWSARYPLPPAGVVAVENVQGDIDVEAWDRAQVEVVVVKTSLGPSADPDDVRVEAKSHGGTLALRTVYAGHAGEPVRVDYRLRVPRQVRLERLRTVEGSITVREIEGSVDASTLNGSIEQRNISGSVVASTLNGNVAVSFRVLPERKAPVRLETLNGHIFVSLPSRANADLELSTVAGRIDSKYVFAVSELPGDTSWHARLGRGGVQIRLRTVRGNIRVTESEELL